jgi:hypothetical protein
MIMLLANLKTSTNWRQDILPNDICHDHNRYNNKCYAECLLSVVMLSATMEHHALKSVNNCLNTNIYSYLETSGGQSSNLFLIVVHFFKTSVN